jgi:hypothetical protein
VAKAALARTPETRRDFVRTACGTDETLASEVLALLAQSADTIAPTRGPTGDRPSVQSDLQLAPGQRFGAYRIERPLGRGGMGEVYEAEHLESGHRVAIKLLPADATRTPELRDRFLREGVSAASVSHPHSLYVYGTAEIEGTPVIAMELVHGGTLRDLVEKRGPLPITDAVDAALQVASGLEAAEAAGVLHRDVKPANCFIDRDGSVKVGDYGLSISTSAEEETRLTHVGSFLGTPAYASPEQVRSDALDGRSDIYSLGATLYYLLTGRTPFEGGSFMQMAAAILEGQPASMRSTRPEISRRLDEIVLKCLEKDPARRPQSYDTLKRELEAFSSEAPIAGGRGRRLAAGMFDQFLVDLGITSPIYFLTVGAAAATVISWTSILLEGGCLLVYGALTEGLWGATAGKALFGLRVIGAQKTAPGIPRALLRGLIFWLPWWVWRVAYTSFRVGGESLDLSNPEHALNAIGDWLFLLVFVTARRANGWLGLHGRWSGTRVIRKLPRRAGQFLKSPGAPAIADRESGRIGPYALLEETSRTPGSVVLGYDQNLRRKIWIQFRSPDAPPLPAARREVSRPVRLRWLNGRRSSEEAWDAYEALDGQPLVAMQERAPWRLVRRWLLDLGNELASQDEGAPPAATLDRVWISNDGRAVLLDFPAPGAGTGETTANGTVGEPDAIETQESGDPQAFLWTVADRGLRTARDLRDGSMHSAPLPRHAVDILGRLERRSFHSLEEVVAALEDAGRRRTSLRRSQRIGQMAMVSAMPALIALIVLAMIFQKQKSREELDPDMPMMIQCVRWLCAQAETPGTLGPEEENRRRALGIYLSGRLGGELPKLALGPPGQTNLRPVFRPQSEALLREFFEAHPDPSPDEVERAARELEPFLAEQRAAARRQEILSYLNAPIVGVGLVLLFVAPLAAIVGLAFRQGPLHQLFGVAIVDRRGRPASRARTTVRTLVVWTPLLVCTALFIWRMIDASGTAGLPFEEIIRASIDLVADYYILQASVLLLLAGAAWSLITPHRGPHDRLAGTYLVPD